MARLSYILVIIGIALTCVFAYDDKYDDTDVKSILENDKMREEYFQCFMKAGPCLTPDAKFFGEIIGESYHTNCEKCTEKQKQMLAAVAQWYTANSPEQWEALVAKTAEELKKN